MRIGNIETKNNIFLAPMAGVTDLPFRCLAKRFGCGFTYTEMISAKGLYYGDKKTGSLMKLGENESPAAIQIFGSEPDIIKDIVPVVESAGAAVIDLNFGCPAPKIVNNGDGSALMKNIPLAERIISAAVSVSHVPITVKIRKGWSEQSVNALEFSKMAEAAGASAVAVHGRVREQFYSGKADWDIIAKIKKSIKIPVIGNGDIFSAYDAKKMFDETGCDAVMIARGAQGNPFIFRQTEELINNGFIKYLPTDKERIETAIDFYSDLIKEKGSVRGMKEGRKHLAWFIKGIRGSAVLKGKIFSLTAPDTVISELLKLKDELN